MRIIILVALSGLRKPTLPQQFASILTELAVRSFEQLDKIPKVHGGRICIGLSAWITEYALLIEFFSMVHYLIRGHT